MAEFLGYRHCSCRPVEVSHAPLPSAGRLVTVEELVMPAGGTHQAPKPMVPVDRPVGQNDVGMIAWVLTLRTPECPQGRKVRARLL